MFFVKQNLEQQLQKKKQKKQKKKNLCFAAQVTQILHFFFNLKFLIMWNQLFW